MRLRILLSLSLVLLCAPVARGQTAEDFFHGGATSYLSNNVPVALQQVEEGLKRFPSDAKLRKLEELLKRQQQSQSQQDKQNQEKKDQQPKADQQKQQSKPDENKEQQESKPDQAKKDQPKPDQESSKPGEQQNKDQESDEPSPTKAAPGQMTPQQAKQLLDAQKGEEMMIPIRPEQKEKARSGSLKDW